MTTILEIDLGPLLPAFPEFVAGIVLFAIIYYAMAKVVVPRFQSTYSERAAEIQGGIEKAEMAQAEAAEALQQYRTQLAGARDEASSIREEAKAQGAQILAQMRAQAQSEADRIISQAKSQIEAERDMAVLPDLRHLVDRQPNRCRSLSRRQVTVVAEPPGHSLGKRFGLTLDLGLADQER